jgi:hypothetical protein
MQGRNVRQRNGSLNRRVCWLLTAAVVITGCASGGVGPSPSQKQPGLEGRAIDAATRKSLPDAAVSVQHRTALTNVAGQYRIIGLQTGASVVVVTHAGYADVHQTLTITGKFSTITGSWLDPADFEMQPQP